MKQRWKVIILSALTTVLLFFIARYSISLFHNIKQVHAPTPQTRQGDASQIHHWTTVKELAKRYKISENEVFTFLQIPPQPGDENLSLRALRKKYHLTPSQMQTNLDKLAASYARQHGATP